MKWLDVAVAITGVACGALGYFFPPLAPVCVPAATFLIGKALPQVSSYVGKKFKPETKEE